MVGPSPRRIFINTANNADHINLNPANPNFAVVPGQVFVMTGRTLPNGFNRQHNLVWLDQDRNIAGSLFWELVFSDVPGNENCRAVNLSNSRC